MYIIWLAKGKNHFFNKDVIRESHIWKDVEWGKRAKNYNPKDKDPGNVWIPTKDDGKAHIAEHILLSLSDVINRLNNCSVQKDLGTLYVTSKGIDKLGLIDGIHIEQLSSPDVVTASKHYRPNPPQTSQQKQVNGTVVFGTSERMTKIPNGSVNAL